ncbi:MAG: PrsW family glutamic-type intramembrane protease [Limisphaerales bacterium]
MAYFLVDAEQRRLGPYRAEELLRLHAAGGLEAGLRVLRPGDLEPVALEDFLAEVNGRPPAPESSAVAALPPPAMAPRTTTQALRRLLPHLMLPIEDIRRLPERENLRIVAIAVVGLVPLALAMMLAVNQDIAGVYWGLAIYVSALWALLFYGLFRQPEITLGRSLLCLVGTAILSVALLQWPLRVLVPEAAVKAWTSLDQPLLLRWSGHVIGVGLPEELCKMAMLYFLTATRTRPQAMLFYGMLCGLGFAVSEAISYQWRENLITALQRAQEVRASTGSEEAAVREFASVYYISNFLRLTSLPFLHAMWSGIAGYFIGWAMHTPRHRVALFLVALLVPATLHGTYNTLAFTPAGLGVALLSVLALNLYLLKTDDFERLLAGREKL